MKRKKESKKKKILDYLKTGKSITQEEARKLCKCWRLASRINELKNEGYDITPKMCYNKKEGTKWVKYTLKLDPLLKALYMTDPILRQNFED